MNTLVAAIWSLSAAGAIVPKPSGRLLKYLSSAAFMSKAGTGVAVGAAVGGGAVGSRRCRRRAGGNHDSHDEQQW